jgi:hypothetical protein
LTINLVLVKKEGFGEVSSAGGGGGETGRSASLAAGAS